MKSRIRTRVYNYTLYVQTSHFQIFAADEFLGVDEFESFFLFVFVVSIFSYIPREKGENEFRYLKNTFFFITA